MLVGVGIRNGTFEIKGCTKKVTYKGDDVYGRDSLEPVGSIYREGLVNTCYGVDLQNIVCSTDETHCAISKKKVDTVDFSRRLFRECLEKRTSRIARA
jgi:hypothetical protein